MNTSIKQNAEKIKGTSTLNGTDPCPQLPAELKAVSAWLPWKYIPDSNRPKPRKIPHQLSGKWADTTQPVQWTDYDTAVHAYLDGNYSGLGFLVVEPYAGLDLDGCIVNGELTAEAREIVERFNTYTEVSPSGRGLRLWVRTTWRPASGMRQGLNRAGIELYFNERFLTATGKHLDGTPLTVNDRTEQIRELYERLAGMYNLTTSEGEDIAPLPLPENFLERVRQRNAKIAQRIESERSAKEAGATLVEALYNAVGERVDRSDNDFYIAQWLISHGIDAGVVVTVLTHPTWFSGDKSREKGDDRYAQRTVRRALSVREERRRELPDAQKNWTELGNAERLIEGYGNNLRYCEAKGGWLTWTGQIWQPDQVSLVDQYLHNVVRGLHAAVEKLDFDVGAVLKKWALKSESSRVHQGTINQATRLEGVKLLPSMFDAQPMMFPADNGVVDLRTGELLPYERSHYFTMASAIAYDPNAEAPKWRKALELWLPDPEVRTFVQRAVGYTLTGLTSEQIFMFLHGPGSNGKSTFILVLQGLLGQMCRRIATEAVTMRTGSNPGTMRDQAAARLIGARMGVVSEIDRNARWAEGWLKDLTGGAPISTKILYKDPGETLPTAKLWVDANHEPRAMAGAQTGVQGELDAFWRRIQEIPFRVAVSPKDRVLDFHRVLLREEGPGILAWAVQGCLDWQRNGLPVPTAMQQAMDEYREKSDALKPFIDEWLEPEEGSWVLKGGVRTAYKLWASANDLKPLPPQMFEEMLEERGLKFERYNGNPRAAIKGYKLKHELNHHKPVSSDPVEQKVALASTE